MADRNAGTEKRKIGEEPSADGQSLNLLRIHYLADFRARRFYDRHLRAYHHRLGDRPDLQNDVYRGDLSYSQHDPNLLVLAKSGRFSL